jgi:hypothetical protein
LAQKESLASIMLACREGRNKTEGLCDGLHWRQSMRATLETPAVGGITKPCATGTGFCYYLLPTQIAGLFTLIKVALMAGSSGAKDLNLEKRERSPLQRDFYN